MMIITSIYLSLTAETEVRLNAQTNAAISSVINPVFFTMEKLHRFRISYPSDWNITYDNDSISIIKAPRDKAMLIVSVMNLSPETNITLNHYSEKEINDINGLARDKKINIKFLESIPYLLSGNPGHKIVYLNETQTIGSSALDIVPIYYETIAAWTVVGDRIYRISCSTEESSYPMLALAFSTILNSFELLQ